MSKSRIERLIKHQYFSPTPGMQIFAFKKAKLGENASNAEVCRQVGISQETASRWKQVKGFDEWLEDELIRYRSPVVEVLEQVALDNLKDYRFWADMARAYKFVKEDEPSGFKFVKKRKNGSN